jgi:oxaloacetate decarboxylase (Na+ extruding) subunit alpha
MTINNKIRVTDTTIRDAQQSVWAKYIKTSELKFILKDIDQIGFQSLEVWGGATFENSLRYWKEDPWSNLKAISKTVKNTPLQMLLRGQNVVGYHHFPDDVLEQFIKNSINCGISIIRIFDPLNDIRNVEKAIKFAKKYEAHVQGTVCYTISKYYNLDFFIEYAKALKDRGVDSIALKDTAGILLPDVCVELVKRLENEVGLPIQLHSHLTNGMINVTYYEAVKAGINSIDCTMGPLSILSAQPAIENIVTIFENTEHAPDINKEKMFEISQKLFDMFRQKGNKEIDLMYINDHSIFEHQLPRGSYAFLYEQLKKRNALDKLREVLDEVPKVRHDLGDPPLYIPISQIIVAQAVNNVLMNKRYQLVAREVKDFLSGYYGEVRGPIDKNLLALVKNEKNYSVERPSDLMPPVLENIKSKLDEELIEKESDYISYALFPELALEFFKYRKSPFKTSSDMDIDDISPEEEILLVHRLMEEKEVTEFELSENNHYVSVSRFSEDNKQRFSSPMEHTISHEVSKPQVIAKEETEPEIGENISSPIVGVFYGQPNPESGPYVKAGDKVNEGQTVCIIEAMKVMNEIKAPYNCEILKSLVKNKEAVGSGQALFLVKKI